MKKEIRRMTLSPEFLENYFLNNDYRCLNPFNVVNNKSDTIFITAGIQPILNSILEGTISDKKNIYISQPVIRTQFVSSLSEGYSLAFINSTTVAVNKSEENHKKLVGDWYNFFYELGLEKKHFTTREKDYIRNWSNLIVSGHKIFHFYKNIELGDTTFFNSIKDTNGTNLLYSMSDVGFGLERIRWVSSPNNSYYDFYQDSSSIDSKLKALISAVALIVVNGILPSNNQAGYRIRLFLKEIVSYYGINVINNDINDYLDNCIYYWISWYKYSSENKEKYKNIIMHELERNENRLILDELSELGITNINGININVSRTELIKRLNSANVNKDYLQKILKK